MMSDEQPQDEVPDVEVSRLRIQLLHGDSSDPLIHAHVIKEMINLGAPTESLVPLVLDLYRADNFKGGSSSLVELYVAFSQKEILDSLREKGALKTLAIIEKCELLKWGVMELESDLLEHIWNHWKRTDMWRSDIVCALAVGGTDKALEMLEVIQVELAGAVAEQLAKWANIEDAEDLEPDVLSEGMKVRANQDFLQLVRNTVPEMKVRLSQ